MIPLIITIKASGGYHEGNLGRLDILFRSLDQFALPETFDEILLVTPDAELQDLKDHLQRTDSLAARRAHCRPDSALIASIDAYHTAPWYKQQALKMAAAALWPGRFYMTMDADNFATRPFSSGQFFVDGRALLDMESRDMHTEWWADSAAVLDFDPKALPDPVMTVTPCIYHAGVMMAVLDEIERLHDISWPEWLLGKLPGTQWVEHGLYFLGALKLGLLDRHHTLGGMPADWQLHSTVSIWALEILPHWNAGDCFRGDKGVFACIASSTMLPVEDVKALVGAHIPRLEAPKG